MFELKDIIPHVSVSDIIQKNKRREGRQQLKQARREPFKTFLIEVNCDSCEDGKIHLHLFILFVLSVMEQAFFNTVNTTMTV